MAIFQILERYHLGTYPIIFSIIRRHRKFQIIYFYRDTVPVRYITQAHKASREAFFLGIGFMQIRKTSTIFTCTLFCKSGSGIRYFLHPGSGMNFSGSRIRSIFWWNFLTFSSESLLCYPYETGLLLKLGPETVSSNKKVIFLLLLRFYLVRRIRDEKILISGFGIKHPGSATLLAL
jgi:hypothetical protein